MSYGIVSPALGPWAQGLQPASWRSVPFAVRSNRIKRGRRTAVHDYPYRDIVWVEDIGRGRREISFTGFILGDDVYAQRDAMLDAVEQKGPGNLVHPSLGTVSASVIDFSAGEDAERGGVVTLEFSFIQGATQAVTPSAENSTQAQVMTAADTCDSSCSTDFLDDAQAGLETGEAAVSGALATVAGFAATVVGTVAAVEMVVAQAIALPAAVIGSVLATVGQVAGMVNDAAMAAGAVLGLPGYFGRYASGNLVAPLPASATVQSQLAALTASRAAVTTAVAAAVGSVISDPAGMPAAVQGAVAALLAMIPAPADQLRLLVVLAAYAPPASSSAAPIGATVATVQTASASLVRRAACAALGRAAAAYQPSSYNDAVQQLETLTALLEDEAITAADAGDDDAYQALRSLQTAVTTDLLTRGAGLPQLVTITRPRPMPALALAYDLYGDATRADDLVTRANPVNALFMPVSFQALAS